MTKITYIFGAGASAKALPTVNQIRKEKRISKIARILESLKLSDNEFFKVNGKQLPETKWHYQKTLIEQMDWLQGISEAHASVDTYAKKLTIRGESTKLQELKLILSIYLSLEQLDQGLDDRYDAFFASIIDADGILPSNATLLSWNYDTQFEMGYSEFSGNNSIAHNTKRLGIRSKNTSRVKPPNSMPIYRLNGVCGYKNRGSSVINYFVSEANIKLDKVAVENIVHQYVEIIQMDNIVPALSYAWDPEHSSKDSIFEEIKEDLKGTTVVVIIGYSFPFFNREIDKRIFSFMSGVKKIYYQDMYPEKLVERLKAVGQFQKDTLIIPYPETDQFFIPYEF